MRAKVIAIAALSAVLWSPPARADAAGDAVLKRVDDAARRYKTIDFHYDIVTTEPGKPESKIAVRARFKGTKQLTLLLAPADVRGTKILILTSTQMYVYLPAYRKVRRIASHVVEQPFLGTAFSSAEMSITRYDEQYTARIASESEGGYELELTGKPDGDPAFGKIMLAVDKKLMLPTSIKYFNNAGKHVKTETRRDYTCVRDVCMARKTKLTSEVHAGLASELTLTDYKVDPPMDDDLFSKRSLQK